MFAAIHIYQLKVYMSTLLVQHEYDQTRFFINIGALRMRMNRNVKPTFFFSFLEVKRQHWSLPPVEDVDNAWDSHGQL